MVKHTRLHTGIRQNITTNILSFKYTVYLIKTLLAFEINLSLLYAWRESKITTATTGNSNYISNYLVFIAGNIWDAGK